MRFLTRARAEVLYQRKGAAAPGGSGDHGDLTGLGDDDHSQYHNDARGDARYSPLGHSHSYEAAGAVAAHEAAGDPHPGYLTLTEGNAAFAALGHTHDTSSVTLENRTSDPGSPATGQIWLRTDL
jgi:hypothetical protein